MADETEDKILSNIPDFADDGGSDDTETQDTTAQDTTADTTDAVVETGSEGGGTNTPAQPTATEQPAVTRRDGLIETPNPNNPSARDLVDPSTGQVVARGGIERRIFEGAQRVHRDNQTLQARVTAAESNANNANEIVKLGTTLNLSASDQQASLNLMSQFLKDPVRMLEQLVIEVKSKGYEIPFLTQGISAGMDTAAMQRMLDQKMAPITEARRQQEQVAEHQAGAKRTLDTFLDSHPEGGHNLETLAEMMNAQPGLSIDNAYMKLIKYCASNGLDYSQPLKPQVEAKLRGTNQQPATQLAQTPEMPRQPIAPLPNGRQNQGAAPINTAASFNENSSWADIIRQSMRETGMSR
jgi:hypothetical protein